MITRRHKLQERHLQHIEVNWLEGGPVEAERLALVAHFSQMLLLHHYRLINLQSVSIDVSLCCMQYLILFTR